MEIGERIHSLRIDNDLLQTDIAERLHVTRGAVSSWECGRTEPNIGQIKALAKLFDVSPEFLISGEDNIKSDYTFKSEIGDIIAEISKMKKEDLEMLNRLTEYLLRK